MRLLTMRKAADVTGVGYKTIRRLVLERQIGFYQFGSRWKRIDLDELEAWVQTRQVVVGESDEGPSSIAPGGPSFR